MTKTKKENRFFKAFKFTAKWGWKIIIAAAGAAAIYSNPVSGGIAGSIAIASAISAAVKDKRIKALMPIINTIACNIGNATNDPKLNS